MASPTTGAILTTSTVYLRNNDHSGSYEIDRNLPAVYLNNNNDPRMIARMTNNNNQGWNEFCDKIDGTFRTVNIMQKTTVFGSLTVLVLAITYVGLALFTSVVSFETVIFSVNDSDIDYYYFGFVILVSLVVIINAVRCFNACATPIALHKVKRFCDEESLQNILTSGPGGSSTDIFVTLKDYTLTRTSINNNLLYEFDSNQRQRYPNIFILVSVSVKVDDTADGTSYSNTYDDYYYNNNNNDIETPNTSIATATVFPSDSLAGDGVYTSAAAATATSVVPPVPIYATASLYSSDEQQPSSTIVADAHPISSAAPTY